MAANHVPLTKLLQVCVVIEDLQRTMDHYWRDAGAHAGYVARRYLCLHGYRETDRHDRRNLRLAG